MNCWSGFSNFISIFISPKKNAFLDYFAYQVHSEDFASACTEAGNASSLINEIVEHARVI